MDTIKQTINTNKIIVIVRGVEKKDILPAAEALLKGGIKLIEVTFNQSSPTGEADTCDAISAISRNFNGEICAGAGTVISVKQTKMAIEAGAKYIISPNTDIDVIKTTNDMGAVSIPGALSPSEIASAYAMGADYVKLFPAGVFGLSYIKAVRAPLSHIPMMAVGGVNAQNLTAFFEAGCAGVGIGSNIVDRKLIAEGKFNELTALAKKYTDQL